MWLSANRTTSKHGHAENTRKLRFSNTFNSNLSKMFYPINSNQTIAVNSNRTIVSCRHLHRHQLDVQHACQNGIQNQ